MSARRLRGERDPPRPTGQRERRPRARVRWALALLLAGTLACRDGRGRPADEEILVFAAASLRDVATDLSESFGEEHEARLVFNFAGSNVLARQVVAAPHPGVFLSADEKWMDYLAERGRIVPGTRRAFLSNRLAIVAHRSSDHDSVTPAELPRALDGVLAMADPRAVPAGRYARELLSATPTEEGSAWELLADRIAPTADVRAALALVESDPDILGIVYHTDALASERVKVLHVATSSGAPAIRYSAAAVGDRDPSPEAQSFLAFLSSDRALEIFRKHGFTPVDDGS